MPQVKFDRHLISGYEDIKWFLWRLLRILHQTESKSCHIWRCWQLIITDGLRAMHSNAAYGDGSVYNSSNILCGEWLQPICLLHLGWWNNSVLSPPSLTSILLLFCRATLSIARPMLWFGVRLSVCHARVLYRKRVNIYSDFSPFVRPTILVFALEILRRKLTGTLSTGASNAGGYGKNRDFRPISRFVSQKIQDTHIVTM